MKSPSSRSTPIRSLVAAALTVVLSSAPLAGGQAESTRPQTPQAGAHVGSAPQQASTTPSSGNQEGVKLHGHWIIDVRNPDGTLAEHRDFENTATGYGQELLAALMSGYAVPSDYAIFLSTTGTAPCAAPQGYQGCGIVRSLTTLPASALCQYYTCFTGETYSANLIDSSGTGSTFTLQGNFTATQGGTITGVSTLYGTCPANLSTATALATVTPAACSTTTGSGGYRTGTTATVSTVTVVTSQIVQVTVTFSFS
jgi:hypothetical protein